MTTQFGSPQYRCGLASLARSTLRLACLLPLPLLLAACGRAPAAVEPPAAPARETGVAVQAETPRRQSITRQVHAVGSIAPRHEDQVATELGGLIITAIHVEAGKAVRKGDVLARLGADLLDAEIAVRTARREEAYAAREHARLVMERSKALQATRAIADEEFERHRTDLLTASARVTAAEAEVRESQTRMGKTVITAPEAGVVIAVNAVVGQATQPGMALFQLMRHGRLEWRAEVPALHLGLVNVGHPAELSLADGSKLRGEVARIAPVVQAASRSALVHVLLPPETRVRPGQFARGVIHVGRGEVLTVPLNAVVSRNDDNAVFVLDANNTQVRRRTVTLGQVLGDRVEVRTGVAAEDRVVSVGAGYLADGARVSLQAPGRATAPVAAPAVAKP